MKTRIRVPDRKPDRTHAGIPRRQWLWSNLMKRLAATIRRRPLVGFFVIAYGLSWAVWVPMALAGARVYKGQPWPSHVPGMFGPIAAGLIMSAAVAGTLGIRQLVRRMFQWRVAKRWYLVALSPLGFYGVAAVIGVAFGQGLPNLSQLGSFSGLPLVAAPLMWLLLLVTAFAEETGWRGFAVNEMLKKRSLLFTAVIIGLLWAMWHVPSMFMIESYRQMGLAILPILTLGIVSGSILLAWLYRESGGSVLIVAIWHASYNLVTGTAAAHGLVAAVVSTGVMAWASWIVAAELRKGRRARRSTSGLEIHPALVLQTEGH
ncbi:MAG TPA: type II CAAX endopeptidase family protein [Candidatus Dormibacteraeota bacterium]|jgi:membrane protease YdiL (CAAX protease family)